MAYVWLNALIRADDFSMFHVRAPQRPLCLALLSPCLGRAAGAKWVLAMLPQLELSPRPPLALPPPAHCRHAELRRTGGKRCNLWQTSSCWANGQTNNLAVPLSRRPHFTTSKPPLPTLQAIGWWLWQFHRVRSGRSSAFCLPLHSECLILGSPFKPVCLLSVNTSMQLPNTGLSFFLYFSFCLCLRALGATSVYTEKR